MILADNREGEPDLTGAAGVLEGWFDPETGTRRRPIDGVPRLRVGADRVWGFECWWRTDPTRSGLVPEDHEALEVSKKLLRGLIRDTKRVAFGRRSAT
ncbi:MAG: hypothetical protein HYX56_03125 [Chloroflexi bacterium]|nr:hypothetical protein [Chloroflexota bacterium]